MSDIYISRSRIRLPRSLRTALQATTMALRFCGLLMAVVCLSSTSWGQEPAIEQLFVHRVLPTFKEKCFACHGDDPEELRGEFSMLSRGGLLAGGESDEPALVPGDAKQSTIFQAVNWDGLEMPPKENDRLTSEQVEELREWINGGAPWPNAERIAQILDSDDEKWNSQQGVTVPTSGGLSDDWTNRRYDPESLWGYEPLWNDPNGLLDSDQNPIDVLLGLRLKELGVDPAPLADRRTLIRRVTFGLTGLPPTPKEIKAYLEDLHTDQQAFQTLVERLLKSPHYGEHWAQHWLDVVRYADTSGFANDFERGNAWRYRDYVVRSFNNDKPYDEFIREQIAGDEIDEEDSELLVAAGFLRMGPWELTGMEVPKVARQRFLDDVTDAVGQVFLAHMLQCARCHDHKFDPVPTRDYYSMQAIFATTQLAERKADFLAAENQDGFDEAKYLKKRLAHFNKTRRRVEKKETLQAARKWLAEQGRDPNPFEETVRKLTKDDKEPNLPKVRDQMAELGIAAELIPPKKAGFEPRDFGIERICRKEAQRLAWRLDRYKPFALSVYSGKTPRRSNATAPYRVPNRTKGDLEKTAILTGGDPFSPSEEVTPGMLSAIAFQQETSTAVSGRRTDLANWIASKKNPLTARVMVNRIWQWHFGQPLAGNPNNFGATGKKPSHPRLLDYLAQHFMDSGWSVKAIHKLILSSEAYRRSVDHPNSELLAKRDPNQVSYARFLSRRLTAEELRDAILSCSGELNKELGGIPIRPEMNREAAMQPRMVMGTFAEAWQPSPSPTQRHRRSIYALRVRGLRDPFLEVFNSPSSEISCESREASMVTPQVFAMFNSETTYDRALAMAKSISDVVASETIDTTTSKTYQRRVISQIFERAYGRAATRAEVDSCIEHWRNMTAKHESIEFEPTDFPTEIQREAVEENTGVKFTYVEPLEFYEDFVPDLKPWDASSELRGLAEVCLIILNANEFAYVY